MSLIHNEQTKLTATLLNGVAIASIAVGVIAPIASGLNNPNGPAVSGMAAGAIGWLIAGGILHLGARAVLKRMR